jgi:hypothetical protein
MSKYFFVIAFLSSPVFPEQVYGEINSKGIIDSVRLYPDGEPDGFRRKALKIQCRVFARSAEGGRPFEPMMLSHSA